MSNIKTYPTFTGNFLGKTAIIKTSKENLKSVSLSEVFFKFKNCFNK